MSEQTSEKDVDWDAEFKRIDVALCQVGRGLEQVNKAIDGDKEALATIARDHGTVMAYLRLLDTVLAETTTTLDALEMPNAPMGR